MDNWSDDVSRLLEQWLEPTVTAIADFATEVEQTLEEVGESWLQDWTTTTSSINLENLDVVGEMMTIIFHFHDEEVPNQVDNGPIAREAEDSYSWLNPKVAASANVHPACRGCRHYHGRVYNNSILVCGMYPYGVENERCGDWEAEEIPQTET